MDKNKLMSHKTFFYLIAIALAVLGILRAVSETSPERSYAIAGLSIVGALILAAIGKKGWFKDKGGK